MSSGCDIVSSALKKGLLDLGAMDSGVQAPMWGLGALEDRTAMGGGSPKSAS